MDLKKIVPKLLASVSLLSFPLLSCAAHAAQFNDPEISKTVKEFNENPTAFMEKIPEKKVVSGEEQDIVFSSNEVSSKDFVLKKDDIRKEIIDKSLLKNQTPSQEYFSNDNPRSLLDEPQTFVDSIAQIDSKKLQSGSLDFQPWSDTYWPLYLGNIAFRYSDPNMPSSQDFNANMNYILYGQDAKSLIAQGRVDDLSPAEKYDLLMNDPSFSLTHAVLDKIKERGQPETWEGICHGWAPASFMYRRPVRTVTVANSSGTKINFFPSDIKALSSVLWTDIPQNTKFVGGRCTEKDPPTDSNGRVLSQDCFDSNPATVHLALVNSIGINKKSFVFDATYDYQVWNQPVLSYSYVYFNPMTGTASYNSRDVMIDIGSYTTDKFKSYRSRSTTNVVGVKMTLKYIVETAPSNNPTNSPRQDGVRSVDYYYDLELNNAGKVVGGEWYQKAHPDFMWTPDHRTDVELNAVPYLPNKPWSYMYANYIWNDNPRSPMTEWGYYSKITATQSQLPLDHIVKNLSAWASVPASGDRPPELCTPQPCVPSVYNWHN